MFDKMLVRLGVWRGTGFNKWSRPANEFKRNGRRLTGVEGGEQTFAQMQAQTAALDNVSVRSWRSLELERESCGEGEVASRKLRNTEIQWDQQLVEMQLAAVCFRQLCRIGLSHDSSLHFSER